MWFPEQSAESLAWAIRVFESQAREFNPHAARRQALTFALPRFEEAFFGYLAGIMEKKATPGVSPLRSLRCELAGTMDATAGVYSGQACSSPKDFP